MILQCKETSKPHPEGIYAAVCVDMVDLGLVEVEYQGQVTMKNKLKLVFETEAKWEDGRNCTVSKNFTASLNPKSKLYDFLGKWRGRAVVPGETIDLGKVIGACCTLVISHQQNLAGKTYASINVSKPSKKIVASGGYDPAAARQRMAEWRAKQVQSSECRVQSGPGGRPPAPTESARAAVPNRQAAPARQEAAATTAPAYDPEVGF